MSPLLLLTGALLQASPPTADADEAVTPPVAMPAPSPRTLVYVPPVVQVEFSQPPSLEAFPPCPCAAEATRLEEPLSRLTPLLGAGVLVSLSGSEGIEGRSRFELGLSWRGRASAGLLLLGIPGRPKAAWGLEGAWTPGWGRSRPRVSLGLSSPFPVGSPVARLGVGARIEALRPLFLVPALSLAVDPAGTLGLEAGLGAELRAF